MTTGETLLCALPGIARARVNERRESLAKVTGELIKNKTLGSSDLLPRERERERGGERERENSRKSVTWSAVPYAPY